MAPDLPSVIGALLRRHARPIDVGGALAPYLPGDPRLYNPNAGQGTDDTAAVQSAFNAGGEVHIADGMVYLVGQIVGNASVRMTGGGTIRQLAKPGFSMIYYPAANPGLSFDAGPVTYDGNQAAQGANPNNITLDFRSAGSSSTPTILNVQTAHFINGCAADVRVFSNQTGGLISAKFGAGTTFYGGTQGDAGGAYVPRSIDVADAVDLVMVGCDFDLGAAIAFGRAGLVAYYNQSEGVPTNVSQFVRARVIGCTFNRMGRDQPNTQGCIDLYGYTVDVVVLGNVCRNYAGRAINVKGSDPRVLIAVNQVDTPYPGLTHTTAGITLNASTTTDVFSDAVIATNIVNGATGDGIFVNGFNVNGSGTIAGVVVRDNTTRACAGRDIALQGCTDADVLANRLYSNSGANSIGFNNCAGLLRFLDNRIVTPAARGILSNAGDNNSAAYVELDGNIVLNPGSAGPGSAAYLSNVAGAMLGRRNRFAGATAPAIFLDQSAVVTGTIAGSVLTATGTPSGVVAIGMVVTAPGSAASNVSIPGLTISSFGTYNPATGTGTLNLSGSPAAIGAAQTFLLTQPSFAGSLAPPATLTLNNNTLGTVTVYQEEHALDTYNAQAAGNLFEILGGWPGMVMVLKGLTAAHVVTVKDNAGSAANGNIHIGADFALTALTNSITLTLSGVSGFWELVAKN